MDSRSFGNIVIFMVIVYSIVQILSFYGIGANIYGSYISFYIFLLVSTYILNTEYPQFT